MLNRVIMVCGDLILVILAIFVIREERLLYLQKLLTRGDIIVCSMLSATLIIMMIITSVCWNEQISNNRRESNEGR
jgi:glucan phosphoethanolaminetransferase (alkaline phosphatase superfamily)